MPFGTPRLGRDTLGVIGIGIALTATLTFAAARAHAANEERLLTRQADEVTAVLQAAIPAVLGEVRQMSRIAGLLAEDTDRLSDELAADVREGRRFVSVTVLRDGVPIVSNGAPSALPATAYRDLVDRIRSDPEEVAVTGVLRESDARLVYASGAGPTADVVVIAEQRLAEPRINVDRRGDAFEGIDYAIHLGGEETTASLVGASSDRLPLDGRRAVRTVPFGDESLRFVVSPRGTLGGGLLAVLPWLTAAAGLVSGSIAAVLVESLHRRRRDAEAFTAELQALYRREHVIAHTLQHSLLPTHLDRLEDVEVGARYFAGAEGAEIGGDWYDVISHPQGYTVVVGDVVGRGVKAAAVMAAMRYATHAVASQETSPAEVLESVNALEHIRGDFVTMLCGRVDPATRSVTFASAGHPPALLLDGDRTRFLQVAPGPPIGFLDQATYETVRTTVPAGAVLVLFTDGLYERRGESIEDGLERLRRAGSTLSGPVDDILDRLAEQLLGDGVSDDTAMLAFRMA